MADVAIAPARMQSSPALTATRGALRMLARLSPSLAADAATQLFLTPRRFRTPEREQLLINGATPFFVRLGVSIRMRAWRWGSGPVVLLAHGWEGRGSQMASFARPLVEAGFSVVTWDAPGHGGSTGRRSSLPHFSWGIQAVAETCGGTHAVIAHSLACAATTLALRDGLRSERLVYVSPPLNPVDYTRQFGMVLGLDEPVIEGLQRRIEEKFARRWAQYSLAFAAPSMKTPLMIVHDRDDDETPYRGGARLAELWPGAQLRTTTGLGHRRVLREADVIERAVSFVKG